MVSVIGALNTVPYAALRVILRLTPANLVAKNWVLGYVMSTDFWEAVVSFNRHDSEEQKP